MTSKVLILSSREDVHATRVSQHLDELDADVVFWKSDPFVHDCQLNLLSARSEEF